MDNPSPLSQILAGGSADGQQNPMQGGPTAQQPGGFPAPNDPLQPIVATLAVALKKAAGMATRSGDAKFGNRLDQMAVDLNKELLQRKTALDKQTEKFGGQLNPPPTA